MTRSRWPVKMARVWPEAMSQTRAVRSSLALTRDRPSGANATQFTSSVWPGNFAISLPVAASHSRAEWSPLPVSTRLPSEAKATAMTGFSCPRNWQTTWPAPFPVALPKMPVPGVGWLAYVKDTEGNILGMMQSDPSAK